MKLFLRIVTSVVFGFSDVQEYILQPDPMTVFTDSVITDQSDQALEYISGLLTLWTDIDEVKACFRRQGELSAQILPMVNLTVSDFKSKDLDHIYSGLQ